MRNKMMNRPDFQDPVDLAYGLYNLSCKKFLPLRVPFGKDAVMTSIIKKVLPGPLLHRLTHKMFNKIFFKIVINEN